jgi:hypothetical protein
MPEVAAESLVPRGPMTTCSVCPFATQAEIDRAGNNSQAKYMLLVFIVIILLVLRDFI